MCIYVYTCVYTHRHMVVGVLNRGAASNLHKWVISSGSSASEESPYPYVSPILKTSGQFLIGTSVAD